MWGEKERGRDRENNRGKERGKERKRAPGHFSCFLCHRSLHFTTSLISPLPPSLALHVPRSRSLIYTPGPLSPSPPSPFLPTRLLLALPFAPRRRTRKAKTRRMRRRWERLCSFFFHMPESYGKTKGMQKFQEIMSNRADREIEKKSVLLLVS